MAKDSPKVAMVGNYLPRKCGIATFTTDLCDALAQVAPDMTLSVAAMNDTREGYRYPPRVRFQIAQNKLSEYRNAADFFNITDFKIANVQHEFGIFGGPAGSLVLQMMRDLRMPVVTTLHTVLREPNDTQKRVMEEIVELSDRLVVMNDKAMDFMREVYDAPPEKLTFIHHGVTDMPFVDPSFYKDRFGVEGKKVLLTFGLLSRNKGIENVITVLPDIIKKHPDVVYLVVGATHPHVVRNEGEEYRVSLQNLVRKLDLEKQVMFHDRFVEFEELEAFVGSADICVTPYLDERQMTSGVLSLCMGAGKAVVSTPYWCARQLLGDDRGVIVPFGDSAAVGEAILHLLDNDVERHAIRKRAYLFGREMVWSAVAKQYLKLFDETLEHARTTPRVRTQVERSEATLSLGGVRDINFQHLRRLTDTTGMLQHAKYTIPNRTHGYCTDDNARALVATVRAANLLGDQIHGVHDLSVKFLSFLDYAQIPKSGTFHNFMSYDRRWLDKVGSDDSQGRALWGLGAAATYGSERGFIGVGTRLFNTAMPAIVGLKSPRAVALALIGIHEYLRRFSGDVAAHRAREKLANSLFERFRKNATKDWPWPENSMYYINARLPHALIMSGQWMQKGAMIEMALEALSFLLKVQKTPEGYFEPIGYKGWYQKGGTKSRFDQQPIEVESTIAACAEAWRVTRETRWLDDAQLCYDWFLGRNTLGEPLYDPLTGGCRDGLQADGVNQNEGAESTLAWLLAAITMEEIKIEAGTSDKEPQEKQPPLKA